MNKTIRTIFIASLISASVIGSAALASPVAAQSVNDIQKQIQELLAKVAELRAQLALQTQASVTASTAVSSAVPNRICAVLNRDLNQGLSGDDVVSLQEFLRDGGYFYSNATGYFGPMTAQAVAKWQSAQGISSVGAFGPMSRERLKMWCGMSDVLTVAPNKGSAPLTVTVIAKVGDNNPYRPSIVDGQDSLVDFGDGSERQWVQCETIPGSADLGGRCKAPVTFSHTYAQEGTYTVRLVRAGGMCVGGCAERTIGTAYVQVGSVNNQSLNASPDSGVAPLTVQFNFTPSTDEETQYYISYGDGLGQVMTKQQIYCITTPCISPYVATHTYATRGTYTATVSRYIACLHTNPRCLIAEPPPLASAVITVTGGSSGDRAPSISSFSGPTTLSVGQSGTWSIQANDPDDQSLSYSVTWGDEVYANTGAATPSARDTFVQNTTFTHNYARAGTYTVIVVVRDSQGLEAKTTTTVRVDGSTTACTMEYAPVCGRPSGCANTCAPGMYCTAICRLHDPVTYGNRCQLNAASAQFLHDGVCTAQSSSIY